MTNHNSPQPTEQPEVLYRWVKASERLPEDKRGVQIFRKIGHITTTRPVCLDYTPNVAAYLQTEIGLIEWLEPLPSPQPESVDALGEVLELFEMFMPKNIAVDDRKHLAMYEAYHKIKFLASQVDAEPSPQEQDDFSAWIVDNDYRRYPEGWTLKGGANGWHCTYAELYRLFKSTK